MNEQELIQAIRKHAEANYSKGWDLIVEAYDDGDLLEELSQNNMLYTPTIQSLQLTIDLRREMEENCRF